MLQCVAVIHSYPVMSVAAAAAAPVVGFDVIADHIYAIHAQAVALDGIANTVAGVFRVVGRKLVSLFTEGMGKRKSSTGTAGANPPPAKRRVSVVIMSDRLLLCLSIRMLPRHMHTTARWFFSQYTSVSRPSRLFV